jgi:hypothetical protein
MLSVFFAEGYLLSVVMLSVVMLSFIMLNFVMLSALNVTSTIPH